MRTGYEYNVQRPGDHRVEGVEVLQDLQEAGGQTQGDHPAETFPLLIHGIERHLIYGPQGETFGIIGENGAGKSTLLKILAKTLKPTSGECIVNGRSAALLELGTGFNPEMTGEENIYLTAYLMGLTKPEIDARKQGIIDFSELNDFIGRPVKTYSSGMHVRLAFSIATSVDPDVLIIDEALSVGDEYFQKKCIDRMVSFKDAGKTIVFCSHSMYHIQELCSRVAWIHKGLIRNLGSTGKVVIDYQNFERAKSAAVREKAAEEIVATAETTEKTMQVIDIKVLGKEGNEIETIRPLDPITISFRILCRSDDITGHIGFGIIRNDEVTVFGTMSHYDGLPPSVSGTARNSK
ncbi:MAG: polysaccharide ABC transporter ATP-binding protein [Comamonadaceae bacterium]|nr:polysaccharide ABC transporter ATP-binding protein [Comamonadaceae bacterium]